LVSGQVAQAAAKAGFAGGDLITAVAIAYAESGGNPNAVGDTDLAPERGPSIGLWQINIGSRAHPQYAQDDLTNPEVNAQRAYEVYQREGFRAWSTYDPRNGSVPKYLSYLDRAQQEVGA
jgi:hypothetical protein